MHSTNKGTNATEGIFAERKSYIHKIKKGKIAKRVIFFTVLSLITREKV